MFTLEAGQGLYVITLAVRWADEQADQQSLRTTHRGQSHMP